MILHHDRSAPGAPTTRNGVVVHDSEGAEGLLPWGQQSSAQLIAALGGKGDKPSTSHPGGFFGAGYQAVATEDGSYVTVADDNVGPYHAGGGINPNMWSICIPGRANQTRVQWLDTVSRNYIRAVAAYIVDRWNHDGRIWPLTFRSGAQLAADKANLPGHPTGYTSHAQVTVSHLTSTDHSDPGPSFPWDVLATDIAALTDEQKPPPPTPPALIQGDIMIGILELADSDVVVIGDVTAKGSMLRGIWVNGNIPQSLAALQAHQANAADPKRDDTVYIWPGGVSKTSMPAGQRYPATVLRSIWVSEIPFGDSRKTWTFLDLAGIG